MYYPGIISGMVQPTNYKASAPVTQKTGGQVSLGDNVRGIFGDIGAGVREYTRVRIAQEIARAQPGMTYDPLDAPYANPGDGAPQRRSTGEQVNSDATGALVLAALGGAALAFL